LKIGITKIPLSSQLFSKEMHNRALETSYHELISGQRIVKKVHTSGGSVLVFLKEFGPLLSAIDKDIPSKRRYSTS
jgi:hypothetical protein